MGKIARKLVSFIEEQAHSSRMLWSHEFERALATDHMDADRLSDSSASTYRSRSRRRRRSSADSQLLKSTIGNHDRHYRRRRRSTNSSDGRINGVRNVEHEIIERHSISHWQYILDLIGDVQMRRGFLPVPTARNGVTLVGGLIECEASRISLACMNGEMVSKICDDQN